jgi:hypothetical protein
MTAIELEPNRTACIQTVATREYHRALRAVLHGEDYPGLDDRFTALQRFLESADFPALRSRSEPHVAAGRRVVFSLSLSGDDVDVRMTVGYT